MAREKVCHLYLNTYTGVLHDSHITRCSWRLSVTRWVPLVEQELLILPGPLSLPAHPVLIVWHSCCSIFFFGSV